MYPLPLSSLAGRTFCTKVSLRLPSELFTPFVPSGHLSVGAVQPSPGLTQTLLLILLRSSVMVSVPLFATVKIVLPEGKTCTGIVPPGPSVAVLAGTSGGSFGGGSWTTCCGGGAPSHASSGVARPSPCRE